MHTMTTLASKYTRDDVERIVRSVLSKHLGPKTTATPSQRNPLVVNISARHVHLTQEHVEILFGPGAQLEPHKWLYQAGYYAAKQTVANPKPVDSEVTAVCAFLRDDLHALGLHQHALGC